MTSRFSVRGPDGAPPVVLLPSLGSDRTIWDFQVAALATDHRVIVVEPRGHRAANVPPGPCTLADLGTDVLDATDTVGIDRFHLAGISLGGITALWIAAHHAHRVRTLTVANTAARIGTSQGWSERIELVRAGGMAAICDAVMDRFFTPDFQQDHPDIVAATRTALLQVDPDGYIACCQALAHGDVTGLLERITAPTLVIGATADVSTPPQQARLLHDAIAGSRLELLDDAGHLSNLERPHEFTRILLAHLTAAESRDRPRPTG